VGLNDRDFDVERGDLVCQALCRASVLIPSLDPSFLTSQKPSIAHPDAQYAPSPGVPRWLAIPI